VLMHLPHSGLDAALALGLESGVGDDAFRVGGIKLFADGALGSRTAALLEPYEGTADRGMELIAPRELAGTVRRALEGGLALAIHAIGDRALRNTLDAFDAAGGALGRPRLPSRIEHLQLVDPADAPRLARLGVAASMQPVHCTSDLVMADRAWGSRCENAYPWRRMLASGAALAFGSDAPVEAPGTAAGLFAAITRCRADGSPAGGWRPAERLSLDEALSCYTSAPARLAGSWPRLGTLRPGARADVVVWSDDLHARDPLSLGEARPRWTIADGEVVFRDEESGVPESRAGALPGARRETV
jgi:predicted amidohydrolase YtcJ